MSQHLKGLLVKNISGLKCVWDIAQFCFYWRLHTFNSVQFSEYPGDSHNFTNLILMTSLVLKGPIASSTRSSNCNREMPKSDKIVLTNASLQPLPLLNAVQGFQSKLALSQSSSFGIFLKLKGERILVNISRAK